MELTKKERRALRREERRQEVVWGHKKKKTKKIIFFAAVLAILAVAGYFGTRALLKQSNVPDLGQTFPIEGSAHVSEGTKVEYRTNPPSSGDHYGVPASWGVYDHEIPDEAAVHNLEHGGIWISYSADIPESAKSPLTLLAKNLGGKILLTPRLQNDSPIILVSWGRIHKIGVSQDGFFDKDMIKNFVLKYKNTGPEIVPDNMPGKDY